MLINLKSHLILLNRDLHISNITLEKSKNSKDSLILKAVKENPNITTKELPKEIGVSIRTIKNILKLMKDNKIKRVTGKRYGYWEII